MAAVAAATMAAAAAAAFPAVSGYGGGNSYVINTARNAFGITGGNMGGSPGGYGPDGYVSINFVGVGPRAVDLGDDAHGLRWARLARSPAQAQTHADLTRALGSLRPASLGALGLQEVNRSVRRTGRSCRRT